MTRLDKLERLYTFTAREKGLKVARYEFAKIVGMQVDDKRIDRKLDKLLGEARYRYHPLRRSVTLPYWIMVALYLRSGAALGLTVGHPSTARRIERRDSLGFQDADALADEFMKAARAKGKPIRRGAAECMAAKEAVNNDEYVRDTMHITDAVTFLSRWRNWKRRQRPKPKQNRLQSKN